MKSFLKNSVLALGGLAVLYVLASLILFGSFEVTSPQLIDTRMPPAKSERLAELDNRSGGYTLQEVQELQRLVEERNGQWSSQPMLSEVLSGVSHDKEGYLRQQLLDRRLSEKEVEQFISSVKKDTPHLLR